MIRKSFHPNPHKRLDLVGVWHHPWVQEGMTKIQKTEFDGYFSTNIDQKPFLNKDQDLKI